MLIKVKLFELGKRQTDLIDELHKRGYKNIQPSELSLMISKRLTTPKAETFLQLCEEIIKEWETKTA